MSYFNRTEAYKKGFIDGQVETYKVNKPATTDVGEKGE